MSGKTSSLKNIVIFLNGERGIGVAQSIIENGKDVCAIVAPPKSMFWNESHKNKIFCNCQFFKEQEINKTSFLKDMERLKPDLFIVAGFSTIFKNKILNLPVKGVVNLHGGPLPQYRGGSPLNWQIINNEPDITVSIIQMNSGIDTGDILEQATFKYSDHETIHDVHLKANKYFIKITNSVLDKIEAGTLSPTKQDENQASYWIQRNSKEGKITWTTMGARQVFNLIRALTPLYPGAFCFRGDQKITLQTASMPEIEIKGTPGRVVYIQGKGPYVICKDKAVLVQPDQKLRNGDFLS